MVGFGAYSCLGFRVFKIWTLHGLGFVLGRAAPVTDTAVLHMSMVCSRPVPPGSRLPAANSEPPVLRSDPRFRRTGHP